MNKKPDNYVYFTSSSRTQIGEPSISFSKTGRITISPAGAKLLKLLKGGKVAFRRSSDNLNEWQLKVCGKDENGFLMNKSAKQIACFSRSLAREIFSIFPDNPDKITAQTVRINIAMKPTSEGWHQMLVTTRTFIQSRKQ